MESHLERELAEGRAPVFDDVGNMLGTRDRSTWWEVDLDAIKRGDVGVTPPAFLPRVDGKCLVYAGRNHVFFGPPESLKSWAALLTCKSVLDAGLTALYIDFESDATAFVENARTCGIPDGAIGRALRYMRPEEPLDDNDAARTDLEMVVTELRPALVVLDGVTEAYALHGWDVNYAKDAAKFTQVFRMPAGTASIAIDHTGKDASRGIVGSLHKRAGVDGAAYEFSWKQLGGRGGTSKAEIKVNKDRHGHVRAFAHRGPVATIVVDGDGVRLEGALDFEAELARDDELDSAVVEFIRQNPRCSARAVRAGVPGKNGDIDRALERGALRGALADVGTPNRHIYVAAGS